MIEGTLHCSKCSEQYRFTNGIACLLKAAKTAETLHEMNLRDSEYKRMPLEFVPPERARAEASSWRSILSDAIEIPPHLRMLEPLNRRRVLEFGCGDGRFIMLMAQRGADIPAVDFSIEALRLLARRLRSGMAATSFKVASLRGEADLTGHVGLVQADASEFHAAPSSFGVALSASPLDSRDERMQMYCAVAASLKDDGHYVAGEENDDLFRRLLGMPVARCYTPARYLHRTFRHKHVAAGNCAILLPPPIPVHSRKGSTNKRIAAQAGGSSWAKSFWSARSAQ